MATTPRLRAEYPEFLVTQGFKNTKTGVVFRPKCNFKSAVAVKFLAAGPSFPAGFVRLLVHPALVNAFRALAAVLYHHQYAFRETAGGTLSCRAITGGIQSTLHLHGIALDINPSRNAYRHALGPIKWGLQTDMSDAMIRDVEAIKFNDGNDAFEWGGRWSNTKDPMHFEVDALRTSAQRGINTLTVTGWAAYLTWEAGSVPGGDVIPVDSVTIRPIVFKLQEALNKAAAVNGFPGVAVDGKAGPSTQAASAAYHAGAGLGPLPPGAAFDGTTIATLFHLYG